MTDIKTIEGDFTDCRGDYALVVGRFNGFVVESLVEAATDTLVRHGISRDSITIYRVPGAYEIPVTAQKVARSGRHDAVIALGGNPGATMVGGIPAGDSALVTYATRNGVDPDIRATLAAEDQGFRDRRSRFGGLFARGDRYFQAYSGQALDAHAALARFRNAGVAVPSAPPAP